MTSFRTLVHEIHRRSLWQVLGAYALASWIIYQVVLALWEGIGLPSWVPGTALVLLLIGLPIVLATTFVQEGAPGLGADDRPRTVEGLETTADALAARRRAAKHAEDLATETGEDASSAGPTAATPVTAKTRSATTLFTWRKAVTGGVLAFAFLGLAASGFMGMRALGIGPAATLISSGVLVEREPLVLLRGLEHGLVRSGMNISATPSTLALASVHERVAELLEERERTPEAVQHYAAVVDLWANADPELQPRVEAARRALERLTAEGGS